MGKTSTRNVVLLLTHARDYYTVDRVAEALSRRGASPFRLDTDRFPLDIKLSARLAPEGFRHVINYRRTWINADNVKAIWARKIWTPRMDENLDSQFHALCINESSAMLQGFLDVFHSARWVNDLRRDHEAENKLRQLRIARDVGLRIPRTLTTNDPEQARAFFEELGGNVVAKLLRPLSISMGPAPLFVYTSVVKEQDLAEAERLRHSPMVFQERIPKATEFRIAFINGQLFTGAIDASNSIKGQSDWRLSAPDECHWKPARLSDDVASHLRSLMDKLGLVYGAIDMIRTPEGEHVFLEVNPGGEWGMLERDLSYPISEAIADALLK
jgi:MvdC family ATP-grasp ribosomal peptide maturase